MSRSLYLAAPLLLLWLSIPLTLLAILTTTLALSVLLVRVSVVYFELTLALIRSYIFLSPSHRGNNPKPQHLNTTTTLTTSCTSASTSPSTSNSPTHSTSSSHKPRRRNSSTLSFPGDTNTTPQKSESFPSLLGSNNPNRDFESVGGWRLLADGQDDGGLWLGHSRLQLPTPVDERRRHHRRSLTGGSQRNTTTSRHSPEIVRISPVASRTRMPNLSRTASPESYFGMSARGLVELSPDGIGEKEREREREKERGKGRRGSASACLGVGGGGTASSAGAGLGEFKTMVAIAERR